MKTVILTGNTSGLGLKLYQKLQRYNFNLATISRSQEYFENDVMLNFTGDISDWVHCNCFIYYVQEKFKTIDYVINNAGIIDLKPFMEYSIVDYNNTFETNVKGSFFISQAIIKHMLKQPTGGHIINIGSTRSITGAPNKSLYSMSKFALRGMTQCINTEFKEQKITSTIVCPGKLDEGLTEEVSDIIVNMIDKDIRNVPEIIVGGQL